MKIVVEFGVAYLEEKGDRVALTISDLLLLKRMTPMGRKVTLRKRAIEKKAVNPDDPEARLIQTLLLLPAGEWRFIVPD